MKPVSSSKEKAFCVVCKKELLCGKSELTKHAKYKKHIQNFEEWDKACRSSGKLDTMVQNSYQVQETEARLVSFVVENNLSLVLVEDLVSLIKTLPPRSVLENVKLAKQKATNMMRQGLAGYYKDILIRKLRTTAFSVIIDETTDISTTKQLAICVIFCSEDLKLEVDLVACEDESAKGIYETVKLSLQSLEVPMTNLIGFCADTTNMMMGNTNSVSSMFKRDFPWIVIVKCTCHLSHLCASYACKKLPKSLEDLCRTVYSHFSMSAKRGRALKEFQDYCNLKPHKILSPGQTRWLSLEGCVKRLLQQWNALKLYFTNVVFEDPTHGHDKVLETLQNPLMKTLLEFVSFALGLFNEFNCLFQTEDGLFYRIRQEAEELVRTFASSFMNLSYIRTFSNILELDEKNEPQYLPLRQVYLGMEAHDSMALLSCDRCVKQTELDLVYRAARDFYVEAIAQIKARFKFEDPIFEFTKVLDPKVSRELSVRTLSPYLDEFSMPGWDKAKIDAEWRRQAMVDLPENLSLGISSAKEYWGYILNLKNGAGDLRFAHLKQVIQWFLTLPFSNVVVERLFSDLKNIKTDHRNRLGQSTTAGLLQCKYGMKRAGTSAISMKLDTEMQKRLKAVKASATSKEAAELVSQPGPSASVFN